MMRIKIFTFFILTTLISSSIIAQDKSNKKEDRHFEINKNIEVFNSVIREIDMIYVDTVNVTQTVRKGIDYMLNTLDPYTQYFSEEDLTDFTILTTGEYAGIGSSIVYKDGKISITEPFEGKPATIAGLKAGDYILEIDGKDMTKCESKEGEAYAKTLSNFVSSNLKGQPGSKLKLKVERPGNKKPLTFDITRELITVDPIPYYGIVDNKIGYIAFSSFTAESASKVKDAFKDLKNKGIDGLVLDLRGNLGGLMEDAIQIVNLFVPKGKKVLSTEGKFNLVERIHYTTLEPVDAEIPIVILIDKSSASSSEIVAGALQDMDRAVLVGERTFGKGLVQTPRQLPYGGMVKVTTSKYFIPSGRNLQTLDYSHRNSDGDASQLPDSLTTVFYTEAGREVRDKNGVKPDVEIEKKKTPNLIYYLNNQFIVFDWVTNWSIKRKSIGSPDNFSIAHEDYENFKEFVKSKDFQYDRISAKTMNNLKEVMEFEGYMESAEAEFKALEAKLVHNLDRDLDTFKDDIVNQINIEIIKRYYYKKGEVIRDLKTDNVLETAIKTLKDKDNYKKILSATIKKEEQQASI